jgi:hypothetical protein
MGLETGTYISSLNSANPVTGDNKTEGDDHIRLIKSTILATFPNITGAVTPTHTQLNQLATNTFSAPLYITNQTSFFVGLTSDQTSGTTILFDSEDHDYGNNYSTGTGTFTAPYTGIYLVSFGVNIANNSGSGNAANVIVKKNGSITSLSSHLYLANNTEGTMSGSGVILMTATNTLIVTSSSSLGATYKAQANKCYFSARLLG